MEDDINDVFDAIACSEVTVNKKGFEDGYNAGKEVGYSEGHHLGYHKGAEVGSQIGFYAGFVENLLKLENNLKDLSNNDKINLTMQKLKGLIDEFPRTNDPEYDVIDSLEKCKNLYKKLCAFLKIKTQVPEAKFITY